MTKKKKTDNKEKVQEVPQEPVRIEDVLKRVSDTRKKNNKNKKRSK